MSKGVPEGSLSQDQIYEARIVELLTALKEIDGIGYDDEMNASDNAMRAYDMACVARAAILKDEQQGEKT